MGCDRLGHLQKSRRMKYIISCSAHKVRLMEYETVQDANHRSVWSVEGVSRSATPDHSRPRRFCESAITDEYVHGTFL